MPVCPHCQTELTEIHLHQMQGPFGIGRVFVFFCPTLAEDDGLRRPVASVPLALSAGERVARGRTRPWRRFRGLSDAGDGRFRALNHEERARQ